MRICVPITGDDLVDGRWGRAHQVAVADIDDGEITGWWEHEVCWDALHDTGSEGAHHARVARFVREQHVGAVVAEHMGPGMMRMLRTMGITVYLGAHGDARQAVTAAADLGAARAGNGSVASRR
ncbi:NifB/NifX family molybdenum-iron cluster-binding protein [Actinocrinis sp.]|uniref:NifB/NifX family molybdenum-iron cluster-binding protein n=1 Tax=Actinocrinis sp. TaxID=1920516 RepID=UPI002D62A97E|nr:NifB/NifX family molybdenum-iron cluster-binding protein [Actinocrinis sp.]HZP51319.1 NifB/NifX family molybdenum-iron cluster-binding protein [Actinocrinis sp.]